MSHINIPLFKYLASNELGYKENKLKVVVTPLRICPLGAHVDHQYGHVAGMTLDEAIMMAFVPRNDSLVVVKSHNFKKIVAFDLNNIPNARVGDWGDYARGAALALKQKYELNKGFDAFILGKIPVGGLSSSAAVGVGYLLALEYVNDLDIDEEENIRLDSYIENNYFGLKNGVLDQSIILLGKKDSLIYLNTETLENKAIRSELDKEYSILIAYSGIRSSIGNTDYNNRVTECEEAAKILAEKGGIEIPENKLGHIPREVWEKYGDELPDPIDRRAKHFFTETARVSAGIEAWEDGDLEEFGRLINESGESSVHDYESGNEHLTTLFNILKDSEGVYGARFSGAGFRGSCIGIVDPDFEESIADRIESIYPKKHPDIAKRYSVHFCGTNGAARVEG